MTNFKEIDKSKIYHYCKLTTAIEHILDKKQLLLSPLLNTNDPRENKSFAFAGSYYTKDNPGNLIVSNEEISNYLRQDCKLVCFSLDSYYLFGYEYSRMWANYGDRHKGICLEIDKNGFIQENNLRSKYFRKIRYKAYNPYTFHEHKEIDYTEKNRLGQEQYLRKNFRNKHLDYLYFTKTKEWESEKEMRLIYFSDKRENEYVSIKNSLTKIYLGVDFNDKYLPSIVALTGGIEKYKLEYNEGRMTPKYRKK